MRNNTAATLKDVAHAAGVSPFTVSVVLNGSRSNTRVSEATRLRIVETAERLHYRPNAMARGLARQHANVLGVLFGVVESKVALVNPYASAVVQGIVTRAAERGYDVMLYTEPWRDASQSARRYRDGRTDGMILVAPLTDTDMLPGLATLGLPLVAIAAAPDEVAQWPGVSNVDVDSAAGIREAVRHLQSLGHRRIAHLTGDSNVPSVPQRVAAFQAAMTEAGLIGRVIPSTYDGLAVPETMRALFSEPEPPTAIVAGNDNIAIAVLAMARTLGISVPEMLSVVGFDDIPAAAQVTPPLTTVRQPTLAIGETACDRLLDRIENPDEGTATTECLLLPQLIVRESTGAPAA